VSGGQNGFKTMVDGLQFRGLRGSGVGMSIIGICFKTYKAGKFGSEFALGSVSEA